MDSLKVGAVITAAGESRRMEGLDKIFATVAGRPVLAHVLHAFQACAAVDQIVVVLNEASLEQGNRLVRERGFSKVSAVCQGGQRRQDSVWQGISRLKDCGWVVVHDGARPCVTPDLIEQGLSQATESGAAIAALPANETIKAVSRDGLIASTPGRANLWTAQTPQVFRSDIIVEAYERNTEDATDDAYLVEAVGHRVKVYRGSPENIKITTPLDLALADFILRNRESAQAKEQHPERWKRHFLP